MKLYMGFALALVWAAEGAGGQIDPLLLSKLASEGEAEMLVVLRAQADTWPARAIQSKEDRGRWVVETLRSVARTTQGPVIAVLERQRANYRPFWIVNMIWTRGDVRLAEELAALPDVDKLLPNPRVPLEKPELESSDFGSPYTVEWGISKVGAPNVWALGFKGQGVVVAGQDTGYSWTHPALKSKYRGWNGASADHNYNWHDAIHSGGGVCGANSPFPCDDDGHGTHTMGTMVGDDGAGNQIGMAPDAKWIGCRNMDQGVGTPATYAECFQWFIAPTDLNGQNPDPAKAPHVINNSWGCPPSEGCTDPTVLQAVVENVRNAGIVVVVSAGNSGPSCSSVEDPPAIYDAAFSVGATSSSDTIASFSSRGPVTIDGSGRLKPDISAPGVSVRSSLPGGGYGTLSGTSMAGPHVAGGVALLLSAVPNLKGQVTSIETRLAQTASHAVVPTGQVCGGIADNVFPNNTYGYGRLDILAAVSEADLAVSLTDTPDPVNLLQTFTYTAQIANQGPLAASSAVATFTLDPSLNFLSSSMPCTLSGLTLTCNLGSLPSGSVSQIQVNVSSNSAGSIVTTVTVSSATTDYNSANNTASASTTVLAGAPDLEARLTTGGVPTLVGRNFQISMGARNIGTALATSAQAQMALPQGVVYVSGPLTCSHSAGLVTCSLGNLAPGATADRAFYVRATQPGSYIFAVDVSCGGGESELVNNHYELTQDVLALTPLSLVIGDGTGGNGVWEPGETVEIRPAWYNPSSQATSDSGSVTAFSGPAGGIYQLLDSTADYPLVPPGGEGSCNGCYLALVADNGSRPQAHWDVSATEELSWGTTANWTVHVGNSFGDVPSSHWAYKFVETLYHNGVTAGCGPAAYCPLATVTRGQMAVFIARVISGGVIPPQGTVPGLGDYDCQPGGISLFNDVAPNDPRCPAIHYVAANGITAGCGAGNYCPEASTTRGQMAVFLAKSLAGNNIPPSGTVPGMGPYQCGEGGTSVFLDVDPLDSRCPHIHYVAAHQISVGCGGGNFCPGSSTRRDQMAVFLTKAFGLGLFSY